jgi:peptide/nickel transport system ATP-binding protein
MKDLKKTFNTSMIMITHDLGIVAEVCDEVSVMYAGRVVEHGTLVDIFEDTKHPYTKGLFNSLPNINNRSAKLTPIKGLMPDPTNLPSGCSFHPRCDYAKPECALREPRKTYVGDDHYARCLLLEEEGGN